MKQHCGTGIFPACTRNPTDVVDYCVMYSKVQREVQKLILQRGIIKSVSTNHWKWLWKGLDSESSREGIHPVAVSLPRPWKIKLAVILYSSLCSAVLILVHLRPSCTVLIAFDHCSSSVNHRLLNGLHKPKPPRPPDPGFPPFSPPIAKKKKKKWPRSLCNFEVKVIHKIWWV